MDRTIIHFEIPANNPQALSNFYRQLFGWKIEKTEGPMEYWLIETAPEGKGIGGGMMRRETPSQTPMNYILVESVDDFSKKIQALGGRVVVPKQAVPQMGYFAVALDPEGNPFGLWEDDPQGKVELGPSS